MTMTKLEQAQYLIDHEGFCDDIICHDCFIHDISLSFDDCRNDKCVELAKKYIKENK